MPNQTTSDKILIYASLASPAICKFFHNHANEKINRSEVQYGRHVFITGMARAGTTSLLNSIFATGDFYSLTYKQLPFIFSPKANTWFDKVRDFSATPIYRAHFDNIKISLESPEALDGMFWKIFDPVNADYLTPRQVPYEALDQYTDFVGYHLSHSNKTRYLSKMNQNLFRVERLANLFKNSKILVLYRNPLEQAKSILAQHLNFQTLKRFDAFFLNALEHHEFGMLHKPFFKKKSKIILGHVEYDLGYWLQQWCESYSYVLDLCERNNNVIPLPFNELAPENEIWKKISNLIGSNIASGYFNPLKRNIKTAAEHKICDENSSTIYEKLYILTQERLQKL